MGRTSSNGKSRRSTAVIYARVSSKEQNDEGYSIPAQLRLLRDYAREKGIEVVEEFTDAETAKQAGRTSFAKMLQFIKAKSISTILVEKTDRLYRNFADFVKVDELGSELHFVKEGQVISVESRSADKFMHSIRVCMAKNYVDNLSEEIRKGMAEKARQGIYPTHAPLGYLNAPDGPRKKIVLDPDRGVLVTRLFEAYASGSYSLTQLTQFAREIGLVTKKHHQVQRSNIALMLQSPVYSGRIVWNGESYPGTHTPLVDKLTFDRVQDILHGRRSKAGFGHREFAFKGLVYCRCGAAMTGDIKKGKYIYYRCNGRKGLCDKPSVKEEVFIDHIRDLLSRLSLPPEIFEWLRTALKSSLDDEQRFRQLEDERMETNAAQIKKRLETLYLDKIQGDVSAEFYRDTRQKWEEELDDIRARQAAMSRTEGAYYDDGLQLLELARTAADRYESASVSEKRELLQCICSNCIFDGSTISVNLRKPFDLLLKAPEFGSVPNAAKCPDSPANQDWWRLADSNR